MSDVRHRTAQSNGRSRHRSRIRYSFRAVALAVLVYLLFAYVAMPGWWRWHTRSLHPALQDVPRHAYTHSGIQGDPLNVAIIGTDVELTKAMLAAGWYSADPITPESAVRMAEGVVLRRPYPHAPVSNLYVWGRKEDKAFEQPVGHDPRRRHHVRFWQSAVKDDLGQPLWIGSATYDTSVEVSRTTGQITHHVAADVDAERDKLVRDLRETGFLAGMEWLDGFQPQSEGRNGGGDPYRTDRRLAVVLIRPPGQPTSR